MAARVPDALRLPAAPLLAAVERAAHGRGVTPSSLLGNTGYQTYARAHRAGTVTLRQAEATCDRLGCHPYELYGAAYQRLSLTSAPGPLDPDATVTAWHEATCTRPGCGRPIRPGDPVGLVRDVGPCCAACCRLGAHKAPAPPRPVSSPGTAGAGRRRPGRRRSAPGSASATAATAIPRPREGAA
jgi:hypothetical protein